MVDFWLDPCSISWLKATEVRRYARGLDDRPQRLAAFIPALVFVLTAWNPSVVGNYLVIAITG
jgi:hypothetical protein